MPTPRLEDQIARLYQLPLADFTAERNMLAKQAGPRAADVRGMAKPPVAAWAVNQVYWQHRKVYDRLIEAAGDLRAAHAAVLGGKRADVRESGKAHEEAIDAAIKAALAVLREAGQPATDATRQAIATTLRALPASEPPGQLARVLQPGGFEMLAGLPVKSVAGKTTVAPAPKPVPADASRPAAKSRVDVEDERKAREAAAEADRAVRLAEHNVRREEFEAARAAREAERAARAVDAAREAVKEAEAALEEAGEVRRPRRTRRAGRPRSGRRTRKPNWKPPAPNRRRCAGRADRAQSFRAIRLMTAASSSNSTPLGTNP